MHALTHLLAGSALNLHIKCTVKAQDKQNLNKYSRYSEDEPQSQNVSYVLFKDTTKRNAGAYVFK